MELKKKIKIKVLVEINEDLLKKIDDFRKTNKFTRRKIIEHALDEFIKNQTKESEKWLKKQ